MKSIKKQLSDLEKSFKDWNVGKTKWRVTFAKTNGSREVLYLTKKELEIEIRKRKELKDDPIWFKTPTNKKAARR